MLARNALRRLALGAAAPSSRARLPHSVVRTWPLARPFIATPYLGNDSPSPSQYQDVPSQQQPHAKREKKSRSQTVKPSLRRVAAEAQRSRDAVGKDKDKEPSQQKGGTDATTKVVTAYCAAEQYDIAAVSKTLKGVGYTLDPCRTGLYPQVVHVQLPSASASAADGDGGGDGRVGDLFVFPSGTLVAWDVDEDVVTRLIKEGLLSAAENPHIERMETEDLEFVEDELSEKSSVSPGGEIIRLGLKTAPERETIVEDNEDTNHQSPGTNLILTQIAFSSGLARSVKLAVLESLLESYFLSTRSLPTILSKGARLPSTRSRMLRKTGELLSLRAQLNLYSELTDSLPDLLWDSKHELGLEEQFDRVGKALDVNVRIRTLNSKMDYAQEIAAVLREHLSEGHGLLLEWLIISLIAIEVAFGIRHIWKEYEEKNDPGSTESLLRRFLEEGLGERRR